MQKRLIILLSAAVVLPVLFPSCGGETKNEETVKTDKIETAVTDPGLDKLMSLFREKNLPYKADTVLMAGYDRKDSLSAGDVKMLSGLRVEHMIHENPDFYLNAFYKIDSARDLGKYSVWSEGLDLGMTQSAQAYALHKLKLDEKTWVLVWVLSYESYPACPAFTGTDVIGTLVYDGKIVQRFVMSEDFGAADPPVSMGRLVLSELTADGKLNMSELTYDDDLDADYMSRYENKYWFAVKDGKMAFVKEKQGSEQKIAHAPDEPEEEDTNVE